jgi:uncharacterized surface anchored protein
MRIERLPHPSRHPLMAILVAAVLAVAFFAVAPVAGACEPLGRIAIQKVVTGDTAPDGPFTFRITGPIEVSLTATVPAGDTWTSDWLPLGTYTITERDAPDGHTITPNPAVLDTDGQTVTVTATNPYRDHHAKLAIHKIETGATAPGATHTFDITGPGETTLTATVPAGDTWTSDWLPLGTYTITERDAPDGHTITPNPAVLDTDGQTVTVTATNPYPAGRLSLTKVDAGDTGATFTIDVAGPTSFTVQLTAGSPWTSGWLPLGAYTITERDAPTGHTINPNPAVLSVDGATVSVTVTNPAVAGQSGTLPATGQTTVTMLWLATLLVTGGLLLTALPRASRRR